MKHSEIEQACFLNHIENALALIEDLLPGSEIDPGVGETLRELHSKGRIRMSSRGGEPAGYNGITKCISLSSTALLFLKHDFQKQRSALGDDCAERLQQIEDAEMRALFELSGILIHEGQHAFAPVRSLLHPRKAKSEDEQRAFAAEQMWYQCLFLAYHERYGKAIQQLARCAQEDAGTASRYRGLALTAPSLVESEEHLL